MATLSFYARGDGSTANNASLNVDTPSQQPTVELTFDSGTTGDLILESNGGLADPDTTVIIDGVSYDFIVELTGDLPVRNGKVPDALEGSQVTVISVVIGESYERFFFVTDGSGTMTLMDQFGNGAIALTNADTTPGDVYICFCKDTDILTPEGYKKVETLKAGDLVLNDDGAAVPILWFGQSDASVADMQRDPTRRPIRIHAHSIKPGIPHADLYVSAQHRVVLESAWAELYFGEPSVMVAAKHMVGTTAEQVMPDEDVTYYHILLEQHDVLVSNALVTESFQPSLRSFNGITPQMRESLSDAIPPNLLQAFFQRPDAMRTLKKPEAKVLTQKMFATEMQSDIANSEFALRA